MDKKVQMIVAVLAVVVIVAAAFVVVIGNNGDDTPKEADIIPVSGNRSMSEGLTDILMAHGGTGWSFGTSSQNMNAVS